MWIQAYIRNHPLFKRITSTERNKYNFGFRGSIMSAVDTTGLPKVEHVVHRDGDVVINAIYVDGSGVPPHAGMMKDGAAKRYMDIKNMPIRDDDILLATYPKSGTHWVWEILNMLVQGKAEYHPETKVTLFFEAIPDFECTEDEKSPRIFNTHLPWKWLPTQLTQGRGKIVHVQRNPKDVLVSMLYHLKTNSMGKENARNITWDQHFEIFMSGKVQYHDGWFEYEKKMADAKRLQKENQIYSMQFEKLKLNPKEEIQKLAEFLGVECDDSLLHAIADKCSFQNLSKASKRMPDKFKAEIKKLGMEHRTPPVIFRKGDIGDWKNHFTVAQNERFNAHYQQQMKGYDLDLIYDANS